MNISSLGEARQNLYTLNNINDDCVELASYSNTTRTTINLADNITNYKFLMLNLYTGGQLNTTVITTVQDFINNSGVLRPIVVNLAAGAYRYWQTIAIYNTNTSILGECVTDFPSNVPSAKLFGIK